MFNNATLVAPIAAQHAIGALVLRCSIQHKQGAFQASSPKTFYGLVSGPALFLCRMETGFLVPAIVGPPVLMPGFLLAGHLDLSLALRPDKSGVLTMSPRYLVFPALLSLAACDGPNEKAGKQQDQAAATAAGTEYAGSGPGKRAGEVQDNADDAARDAKEAEAKAIEAQARNIKKQADVAAEKLEADADAVRDAADKRAEDLKRQAAAAKADFQ